MSAPVGNHNASGAKTWQDAIRRALARAEQQKDTDPLKAKMTLDALAEKFLQAVAAGEDWAVKEFGNRIDGKSVQAILDITPPPTNPPVLNVNFSRGGPGAQPGPDRATQPNTGAESS